MKTPTKSLKAKTKPLKLKTNLKAGMQVSNSSDQSTRYTVTSGASIPP